MRDGKGRGVNGWREVRTKYPHRFAMIVCEIEMMFYFVLNFFLLIPLF